MAMVHDSEITQSTNKAESARSLLQKRRANQVRASTIKTEAQAAVYLQGVNAKIHPKASGASN